jgi:hypothetical protein
LEGRTKRACIALEQDLTAAEEGKLTNWSLGDVAICSGMDGREEEEAKNSRSGDVFVGFAMVDLGWGVRVRPPRSSGESSFSSHFIQSQSPTNTIFATNSHPQAFD